MLEVPEYLRPLERLTRPFPEAAVREALARWEEAGPILLAGLEQAAAEPESVPGDGMLHVFALHLLAEKRDARALGPAVRLARYPKVDDLLGDTITEGLASILASVSGGDPRPIQELIVDAGADEFARGAGVRALAAMMAAGLLTRAELSGFLGELLGGRLELEPGNVWDTAIAVCADFGFREHEEAIRLAYERGMADPSYEGLASVIRRLGGDHGEEPSLDEYRLIGSAMDEMSWWYCFEDEDLGPDVPLSAEDVFDDPIPKPAIPAPVRAGPKVGRNDPCPCGSGKKYKKCCLK